MNRLALGVAGLGLLASVSLGQVLLPPPEKPDGFKKVPPPPNKAHERLREALEDMTEDKIGDQERRNAERDAEAAARQAATNKLYTYESLMEELGDIPFESMIWRDENGQIVELEQPPLIAAFNHNPLMDGQTLDLAFAVLADRREQLELKLIDNAATVKIITSGEMERTSIADFNNVQRMRMLLQQLNLPMNMLNDMGTRGVIDQRQAFMNTLIEKEYNNAMREQLSQGHEGAALIEVMLVPMLRTQAYEPLYVLEEVLLDISGQLDAVAPRLNLREDQQRAAQAAIAGLASTEARGERLKLMNGFVGQLDVEQIKEFLKLAAG